MTAPTPVYRSAWTAAEDTELRRLHALVPVLSYTTIATYIGRKRNACIGRAHRLELPDRSEMKNHGRPVKASTGASTGTSVVKRRRGPVSPARLVAAKLKRGPQAVVIVRTVLADGSAGCLWPSGERPFVFCGCQVKKGLPYCDPHAQLAYKPRRAA